jgi:hypothetical protein
MIPENTGSKGLLEIGIRPLFAALKPAVRVFSLGVLKAYNKISGRIPGYSLSNGHETIQRTSHLPDRLLSRVWGLL